MSKNCRSAEKKMNAEISTPLQLCDEMCATLGAPKGAPKGKKFSKFCPFCKSKGLPVSDFTSHFVKDHPGAKGKVCCPELLKNECGYCHEIGHTPKFCQKLKARDERRKKAKRLAKARTTPRNADGKAPVIKVSNLRKALSGYKTVKENFPALPSKPKQSLKVTPMGVWGGFASMSIAELENILAEKKQAKAAAVPIVKVATKEKVKVALKEKVKVATKEKVKVATKEKVKVATKEKVKVALDPVRDFAKVAPDQLTGRWGNDMCESDCEDEW